MISVRGLSRSYEDTDGTLVPVLDGVDLDIRAGEFVAIVGRSGSGKSTLLQVLGGLDGAFRGEVTVDGTRLTGLGDAELARFRNAQVGFVFQSFHLVPRLTASENVALPGHFSSRATPSDPREALQRVGLADKASRLPSQLSGGERQRVAIARALYTQPKVLLCDEPTGNLDLVTASEVIKVFSDLNTAGLTLVAVTHEERLRSAASRVLELASGRLS